MKREIGGGGAPGAKPPNPYPGVVSDLTIPMTGGDYRKAKGKVSEEELDRLIKADQQAIRDKCRNRVVMNPRRASRETPSRAILNKFVRSRREA